MGGGVEDRKGERDRISPHLLLYQHTLAYIAARTRLPSYPHILPPHAHAHDCKLVQAHTLACVPCPPFPRACSPLYLLGYLASASRVYLVDREYGVVPYTLLLSVVEYKTLVLRGDMETAASVLETIPEVRGWCSVGRAGRRVAGVPGEEGRRGEAFGVHVWASIRGWQGTRERVRRESELGAVGGGRQGPGWQLATGWAAGAGSKAAARARRRAGQAGAGQGRRRPPLPPWPRACAGPAHRAGSLP